jgi:hypothetical protein
MVGALMIMVDGEGHFAGMHTTGAAESQCVDRRFELQAYEAGYSVVRLHANDGPRVRAATLRHAMRWAQGRERFIMFSPMYAALGLHDARGEAVRARWPRLIEQARTAMGERDARPGHNRKRKGYVKD